MRLTIAMIAFNEEDYIIDALDSIQRFADEIVIIDGGSVDDTDSLITEWARGHKGIDVKYGIIPWPNDFGQQRQESFNYATGDWIMRVDSDEVTSREVRVGVRAILASLPDRCSAVRMRQLNLYPDQDHYAADCGGWETWPRIWRRRPELQWVGQVHEHVMLCMAGQLSEIAEQEVWNWNANMIHRGWLNRGRRQARENLYRTMPGSGFVEAGDLTQRQYVIKEVPRVVAG